MKMEGAQVVHLKNAVSALSKAEKGFRMAAAGCERFDEVFREFRGWPSAWALKECGKAREMAERVADLVRVTMEAMGKGEAFAEEEEKAQSPKAKGGTGGKKGGAK